MRTFIGMAVLAVLLIGPAIVLAQQPVSRTEEVSAAFTIEAIDHSTRVVTLRNKAGLLEEVYCGPEVQRFDALKVGDTVTFRYYETVVTALSQPGPPAPPSTTVTRTPGAPGGTIARQTTATVTLEAIDAKTPSVTIRTASGGRSTFRVQDAKNLEGYKAGDQVTITYTRGLAVSVTPPAAAEPGPRLDIYGFAMLDIGYNFTSINPNWFDTMRVTRLPEIRRRVRRGRKHLCRASARAGLGSRVSCRRPWASCRPPSSSSSSAPAWTKARPPSASAMPTESSVASGRASTWSPFSDTDIFPNSIEYWGPTGIAWYRNVQVRWIAVKRENSSLILALERPGASGDQGVYDDRIELDGIRGRFPAPDFTAAYRRGADWGHVRIAGQLRRISGMTSRTTTSIYREVPPVGA